jgi:hypothetical protein
MTTEKTEAPEIAVASKPHVMTIGNAKQVFRDFGGDLESFYQTVYKTLIAEKPRVELPNSNYLHALQLTSLMMRNTHQNFQMLSGSTTGDFLEMLKTEFRGMLSRLAEAKKRAQVIILNAARPSSVLEEMIVQFPGTIEVYNGWAKEPDRIGHFIVADKMVRIEKPHPPLTDLTDANTIEARVIFNSESEAQSYRQHFDSYLKLVTPPIRL